MLTVAACRASGTSAMVDGRATGAEQQEKNEVRVRHRTERRELEDDIHLVDAAAEELRQRHENLWVGAYKGVVHVEKTLRALLERYDAVGRPEVGVQIVHVAADGYVKIIH